MERDGHGCWQLVVRFGNTVGYWAFVVVLVGNVVRATGVYLRVQRQMKETQATLANLQAQDRELAHKLTELQEEPGRDLEMKKRLYLKKDERWLLFEKDGKPLALTSPLSDLQAGNRGEAAAPDPPFSP